MSDRFDELVGEIEDPAERERLLRVHKLLLSVDAPPELPACATRPLRSSCWSRGGAGTRWR